MRRLEKYLATTEEDLLHSIENDNDKEIGIEISGISIDLLSGGGFLEDIPIFGFVAKIYKSSVTIRDKLFLRKVLLFLKEFDGVEKGDRQRFVKKLSEDAGTRNKAGAALTLILERLDSLEKPEIIGRLYRSTAEGKLTFEELRRFCMIVERIYFPDLVDLSQLSSGEAVNEVAAPSLHSLGIVSLTGKNVGTIDGIGAPTWYEVNSLGRKFLAIAFDLKT